MNATDCIFCKIASGEMNANVVYQDEQVVAFEDIHPVAKRHILIIPREHIARPREVDEAHRELVGHMIHASGKIAEEQGLSDYRLVANDGAGVGQSVWHLHFHILGGEPLGWPPFPTS